MMRVADYIAHFVYDKGIHDVFMVTGGGAMFLNDGVAKHGKLNSICNHHEQASAMATVSYAKYNGDFGVCYVTTGCGGTNAVTGVLNAWQDNTPCLFISGQTKRKETILGSGLPLRQFGVQEAEIVAIIKPITKYVKQVTEPNDIAYELEKAYFIAKSGRPGPVWLDIPMDVQGSVIDKKSLKHFSPTDLKLDYKTELTKSELNEVLEALKTAKRPIILAGQGVRLSKSIKEFKRFIENNNIPYVVSRLGIDLLESAHPLFIGRIGNKGDRAGNFAVQNADFVLVLGSRLAVSATGHEYDKFAREAKIIVIDIDPVEHKKNTVKIDIFINADLSNFFKDINNKTITSVDKNWVNKCKSWKQKWLVCLPEYRKQKDSINLYYFMEVLSKNLKSDSVVVSDAGSAFYVASQAIMLKDKQRYITSGGQAEMGYTLPGTIGVSVAKKKTEVIGITGDGSFQMNIQELETIKYNKLPLKIFIWNNNGYLSIRATQTKFFEARLIGTDESNGVSFPSTKKIAKAYGIKYYLVKDSAKLNSTIKKVLACNEPVLCEVITPNNQEIVPTVSSYKKPDGTMVSKPLEDMYPFLDRAEFLSEMIVKPVKE